MIELLCPAGNFLKLKTAFHFGADAVYFAGENFGLRARADNFTFDENRQGCDFAHGIGKKCYVTVNIFAENSDFEKLKDYLKVLEKSNVDAVIVSDMGIFDYIKKNSDLKIHVSTQANVTNKYAAKAYAELGAERIILAREVRLKDIRQIRDFLDDKVMLEVFIHGAMCISYSGRCLLSNFLTGRSSNKGDCAQPCRWEFIPSGYCEKDALTLEEDSRGSYVLNGRDLNMFMYLDKLKDAGAESFKIEGRMKSEYYLATCTNAYRKAVDLMENGKDFKDNILYEELFKTSNRGFTTGLFFDKQILTENPYEKGKECKFAASVLKREGNRILIEQRNRFKEGDELEVVSPNVECNTKFKVKNMTDINGNKIDDAKNVQQLLYVDCPYELEPLDILRTGGVKTNG